jgi:hypothetical protein
MRPALRYGNICAHEDVAGTRNVSGPGAYLRMARDHWVEYLSCRRCQTSGVDVLSTEDKLSWIIQVESVPEGFRVIRSENGSNFYCSACDRQVEP